MAARDLVYRLVWNKRLGPCPGPEVLAEVRQAAGPLPEVIKALWSPGCGYIVQVYAELTEPAKSWSPERKGAARRKALERRIERQAPLFAEELLDRELSRRPDYFAGKDAA